MKYLFSVIFFFGAIGSLVTSCKSGNKETIYKGKLAIKGLCSNYTIAVVDGEMKPELIEEKWIDDVTKKEYKNVFGLGSPCTFPDKMEEGDEFKFVIDTTAEQNCATCMAFYPTPLKKLSIKVID